MPRASEIEPVAPGVWLWRFYDPAVKAELFSTALGTSSGSYLFDPIPLTPEGMEELASLGSPAGIIVTNENHPRAAAEFAAKFDLPIYLEASIAGSAGLSGAAPVKDNTAFAPGLTMIAIDGAPRGEIAVHSDSAGGTMVVGDALINFEPHGFTLLPAKYCTNFKLMRRSLAKLLDYSFDRMFFAHGLPILSGARERLAGLLKGPR